MMCLGMSLSVQAEPKSINTADISLSTDSYKYDNKVHKPGVTVVLDGVKLTRGKDFYVVYRRTSGPGVAKAVVKGKGDYTGRVVMKYYIRKSQKITVPSKKINEKLATYTIKLKPKTTGDGKFKYESLDKKVAVVGGSGTVRFVKTGTVKIKITALRTNTYEEKTKTVTINIAPSTKAELSTLKANYAVAWAKKIAKDDSFHYGKKPWACHHGCYFCDTNGPKSIKVKEGAPLDQALKSYCCNPFVTAAYAHGAGSVKVGTNVNDLIDCKVSKKRINLANDKNYALNDTANFMLVTKPKKITSLKAGDILLAESHALLYIGNGQVADAGGGDDGKVNSKIWNSSIRTRDITSYWWEHTLKIYRYIGG